MGSPFSNREWMDRLVERLQSTPAWTAACAYYSGRIGICGPGGGAVISIDQGRIASVEADANSSSLEADFLISGPDDEWGQILNGAKDLFHAINPEFGRLAIEGDAVAAMRNVKIVWLIVEAMAAACSSSRPPAVASYSPDPVASGRAVTGRYLMVDGVRTYYEEAGEGPALVCFHAACQDSLMYRHVLDELSETYRVIAVDAPAHAKSLPHPEGVFTSLTRHARFNELFLDALGLSRPTILGCSMGGNLVLEMGSRRPGGYRAIISAEGADYTPTLPEFLLDMLLINGQQILEGYCKSLVGSRTPPHRIEEVIWQLVRATPEVMRGDLVGYAGFDQRDQMARIEAPVLLLRGTDDWLVSQDQVEMTAFRLADCQVALLDGTGHYPMIENPVEFNAMVRTFLDMVHARRES